MILLNINLPNDDGFKICIKIRSFPKIPIIFVISRNTNTNIDELMSITLGRDDFIAKFYNTQILLVRINALLKSYYQNSSNNHVLEYNDLILNILSSTIEYDQKSKKLIKKLKIFYYLLINKGKSYIQEISWSIYGIALWL